MPKDVNETIVNIDHDSGLARVWTCNRRVRTKMRKIRAKETSQQAGGSWFELPEKGISFRKPRNSRGSTTTRAASEQTVLGSPETAEKAAD